MAKHYDVDEEFENVQNVDVEDIEVVRPTLIGYVVDKSASMSDYESDMGEALNLVKNTIEGSKEADEMLVSVTQFADTVKTTGYQGIEDVDIQYTADGWSTKLYDAIVGVQKALFAGDGSGFSPPQVFPRTPAPPSHSHYQARMLPRQKSGLGDFLRRPGQC